ncbi:TIGR00303 family protein [Candidatus Synechococcus calcipolaris G9]|uniref:UPF0284 protein L3556_05570 n=1 Tax=Candidatus Synechococcus calcipolaris G9 TaxID=1497997 RepID=A0ABT6EXB6_9SYNE|nr:TIGR00303 family protein [Candidatus Synechococcus calcipolaris]MDG2990403.1 TIGR00303 family protein [Candidatus Synechococcus calcipolaris G9]
MIHGHHLRAQGEAWCSTHQFLQPGILCVLGFTATGLIPGISAAGATPSDRQFTALADGEFLCHGPRAHPLYPLPPLTVGASPALISRAVIAGLELPLYVFDAGLPRHSLQGLIDLGGQPAQCLTSGQALPLDGVWHLWQQGLKWGETLSDQHPWLVIGECVVGGTTTALALCEGLGISGRDRIGSSHRQCNHQQKWHIVQKGLEQVRAKNPGYLHPLECVAAIGDPMQVVIAGMVVAASQRSGVLLAGGSQLLVVYQLAKAIAQVETIPWQSDAVVLGTTRWLVADTTAAILSLAQEIDLPLITTQLNLSSSKFAALRAYEKGYVKEGVGAGGCAIAASLYGQWTNPTLVDHIDQIASQQRAQTKVNG